MDSSTAANVGSSVYDAKYRFVAPVPDRALVTELHSG